MTSSASGLSMNRLTERRAAIASSTGNAEDSTGGGNSTRRWSAGAAASTPSIGNQPRIAATVTMVIPGFMNVPVSEEPQMNGV